MPSSRNATLRFAALYAVTVLLTVVIFSAFREKGGEAEAARPQPAAATDTPPRNGVNAEQLQAAETRYREQLKDKDQTITMLQSEIRMLDSLHRNAVPVTRTVTTDDGEWRQKYGALKATYDKLANESKALERSYQTLADDNRRLVSQLRKSSSNQ